MSKAPARNGTNHSDRWARRIEQDTERLRTSSDPALRRIRQLITQQGADVTRSLVANLMPEDTNLLSGFIVSNDGCVYEFEYDWRRSEPDRGQLVTWRDITDSYRSRAFREPISVAVAMTKRQARTAPASQERSGRTGMAGGGLREGRQPANLNKVLLNQIVHAFNTGDTTGAPRIFSPDYVDHQKPPFIDANGPEEFVAIVNLARNSLPNLEVTIKDVIADGDKLAARLRWHSVDDHGRTVDRETIDILRFLDGLVIEHWGAESWSTNSAAANRR